MLSHHQTNKPSFDSHDALIAHNSAGRIQRYVFPEGTTLFKKGEGRQCAYLIDKGQVHIYGPDGSQPEARLCTLGEGELFGEMALIDNMARTATAVTATEAEIFIIPRDALQERVKGLDPIVSLLISLLIERYRSTRIHMPESIRQNGGAEELIRSMGGQERLSGEVRGLHNFKEQREIARREMKLEQELRAGLERREFVPVLQPILNLQERRIAGFEALIRWQHPERGLVMPNDFIPVAERTGIVQHLDRLMLERACELAPRLNRTAAGRRGDLTISVNLSGINFGTVDVADAVARTLKKTGTDPRFINLEITESALICDPEKAQAALEGLRKLGVSVSLDDFGTGYSSLGYLHKFTIDSLKIDRSFIAQIHDDSKSTDIVRAIIALARNFNLGVVAEGIEKEEDVKTLINLGCDKGQGYLFSRPLSVADAVVFADSH